MTTKIKMPQADIISKAQERQNELTKPPKALGQLEDLAIQLAGLYGHVTPSIPRPGIAVFAGDHGVVAEGVSAFPQAVTGQMVHNFMRDGAAICVLARQYQAVMRIVDVGVIEDFNFTDSRFVNLKIAQGTANMLQHSAMSTTETQAALDAGARVAQALHSQGARILIAGDMGIGNTTPAAALICALTGEAPEKIVGRGTGIDDESLLKKINVVKGSLERAKLKVNSVSAAQKPFIALAELGGLEIAAMVGFYIEAAVLGVPVILDGFISGAAALVAEGLCPGAREWMIPSHCSQEQGHRITLQKLGLKPYYDYEMRLGEGSGAALFIGTVNSALLLHGQMATFSAAGVSQH